MVAHLKVDKLVFDVHEKREQQWGDGERVAAPEECPDQKVPKQAALEAADIFRSQNETLAPVDVQSVVSNSGSLFAKAKHTPAMAKGARNPRVQTLRTR